MRIDVIQLHDPIGNNEIARPTAPPPPRDAKTILKGTIQDVIRFHRMSSREVAGALYEILRDLSADAAGTEEPRIPVKLSDRLFESLRVGPKNLTEISFAVYGAATPIHRNRARALCAMHRPKVSRGNDGRYVLREPVT